MEQLVESLLRSRISLLFILFACELSVLPVNAEDLAPLFDESLAPLLYHPVDIAWDDRGYAYVLCQGDATVNVFDPDWRWTRSFGTMGQAPGELQEPVALLLDGNKVWIGDGRHLLLYDQNGHFQRGFPLDGEVTAITASGPDLVLTRSCSGPVGLRMTQSGAMGVPFGPSAGSVTTLPDIARATSWIPLSLPPKILFLNRFDALLWNAKKPNAYQHLKLKRGSVDPGKFKYIISDACVLPDSDFLVLYYPKAHGSPFLIHYSAQGEELQRRKISTNNPPGMVRLSPTRQMILWSDQEGVLRRLRDTSWLLERGGQ